MIPAPDKKIRNLVPQGPKPNSTNLSIIKIKVWEKHCPKKSKESCLVRPISAHRAELYGLTKNQQLSCLI